MLIQDTTIQEFIDHCKKRMMSLLKGPIIKEDPDSKGYTPKNWKWEEALHLIDDLKSFIISRDDAPEDRKKILERTIGEEPVVYYEVITDLNSMENEGSGGLRVEYPDGEVVSIVLRVEKQD